MASHSSALPQVGEGRVGIMSKQSCLSRVLWSVCIGVIVPGLAWANEASGAEYMAPISTLVRVLVAIVFLVGAFVAIVGIVWAIMKLASGREHMTEGILGLGGAMIGALLMWQVAPAIRDGIQAEAATPAKISPPAHIREWVE